MKLYALPLMALLLTACGGGSDNTTTTDVVIQPTPPEIKLSVTLGSTSITLDENTIETFGVTIDYNGSDSLSFSYVLANNELSDLVSVEYSDGIISVNAKEVTIDTSTQIKVTFSAGNLTDEQTFNISINDVANNYTLNTVNGIEEVRGNPNNLSLLNTDLKEGDVVNFPTENGVALYFVEYQSPYFIALDSLDNIISSDGEVVVVDKITNTLTAKLAGKSTVSLSFADITQQFEVNVTASDPVITGQINYQRVEFVPGDSGIDGDIKLGIENPSINPVRLVVINLLDAESQLVASTVSTLDGSYQFKLLKEDIDKTYKIEVKAQLELDSEINDGFKIVVTDQSTAETLPQQTVYRYTTPIFNLSSGANQQNILLTVGWNEETKSFDEPIAQPFAILDTLFKTASFLESGGVVFSDSLDDLYVNWSQGKDTIERQAAFYSASANRIFLNGEQLDWASIEEWSEVIISHEFTHFYQKQILGRDDSTGGSHQHWDTTQVTIAFSEGLAQAIAYAVHDDWADKRPQPDILSYSSFDDYYAIAQDELALNCKMTRTLHDGSTATFNCYRFSPWEEVTNSYFILSLIADKADTPRTSNLFSEIGIGGLHLALTKVVQSDAYMSVYSLADTLKTEFSNQTTSIDNLAQKLGFVVSDEWGTGQVAIASHQVDETTAMDIASYLPVYTSVSEGSTEQVCFNGGLSSVSINRPGTSRYVRFKAESDGMVLVRVEDSLDIDGNNHSYEFYSKYRGQSPENELLFPNGRQDESEFKAYAGQEYVIDVRGRRYEETAPFTDSNGNTYLVYPFAKNETVCTNVTITKQ
jgi:hypothetical protein